MIEINQKDLIILVLFFNINNCNRLNEAFIIKYMIKDGYKP